MNFKKKYGWHIYLAATFILFGIMLSIQTQTQNRLASELAYQSTADLTIMLKNLSDKRHLLNAEITEAEQRLEEYQQDYADDTRMIEYVNNEIKRLDILTGQASVAGPGIKIILQKENLLYSDVVGLINELWNSGAEAVAINNIRIIDTTAIGFLDALNTTYLTCDKEILEAPYTITAIGNSNILEKGLTMPGGIVDNLEFFKIYPEITIEEEILIPALAEKKVLRYAAVPAKEEQNT